MDFVVVGLGLGTLAILAGVLLLGWVAGRWERAAARAAAPEDAAHDSAVAAGRRGAGQAVIGAGAAVLIATIGALAGSLDDQTGAFFVTTAATVAALGLLVWAYLYRARNPLPPRRQLRPMASADPAGVAAAPSPATPAMPNYALQAVDNDPLVDDSDQPFDLLAGGIAPVPHGSMTVDALGDERSDATADAEPLDARMLPSDDEQIADDRASAEEIPAGEPLPAAATVDDDASDDAAEPMWEQRNAATNGADDAPFALHEDGKVRRDREF